METQAQGWLVGQRILVTGGTTGIGRATVALLSSHGARVFAVGRHEEELQASLDAAPGHPVGVTADVSTQEGVDRLFAVLDNEIGGIDVLVACAGLPSRPLMEMDNGDWRYVVETNLMGYLACARAAVTRMQAANGGHLVFISSISPQVKVPGESVYAATKAGVDAFAETLRKELAESNVKVSVIQPGTVGSDMVEADDAEQRRMIDAAEMLAAEDIADAVLYVLSRADRTDVVSLRMEPRLQRIRS